jgi:hypothetical protein
MKRIMNNKAAIGMAAALIAVATGCASTNSGRNATVCPQCRTVTEEVPEWDYESLDETRTVYRHLCDGCQGALVTLFKEGRLKHQCTICQEEGYRCPLVHPVRIGSSP